METERTEGAFNILIQRCGVRFGIELCVGKAAAQDAGLSEEKRLTKWVCKVFKELGLNKIENSEN